MLARLATSMPGSVEGGEDSELIEPSLQPEWSGPPTRQPESVTPGGPFWAPRSHETGRDEVDLQRVGLPGLPFCPHPCTAFCVVEFLQKLTVVVGALGRGVHFERVPLITMHASAIRSFVSGKNQCPGMPSQSVPIRKEPIRNRTCLPYRLIAQSIPYTALLELK